MYLSSAKRPGQIRGVGIITITTTTSRLLPLKKLNQQSTPSLPGGTRRDERVYCAAVSKSGAPVRPVRNKKTPSENGVLPLSMPDSSDPSYSVKIALDYYSVLKARRVNTSELLKRSYEDLLKQVPDSRYSKDSLNGRVAILRQAADTMLDSDKRRDYDQNLANNEIPTILVNSKHFSGALLLLQESGEMAQVVELGTKWLNQNGASLASKDVALSVAKAYCDLASITLGSGEGIAMCCEELEAALDLLCACDVAPDLQLDISNALKELGPQYILEQLSLPADDPEFAERRERGLNQLKLLLWEVDESGTLSPALPDRQGFLNRARSHLTAAQQIDVFESGSKELLTAIPSEELYDSAMAYVAEGYRKKWPKHIQSAERVLKQIQLDSLTSDFGGTDVSIELALCALLLGHTDRTMMTLGLKAGSPKVPDKDVLAFVKEHSPSEEDLLPGVCALAEVWLKDTIIPNYKEINAMTSSLGEWFQSPSVSYYLRFIEQGKELSLDSAVKLSSSMAKGLKSAVSKAVEGVKTIFMKPMMVMDSEPESVGRLKLPKVDISRLSQNSTEETSHLHYRPPELEDLPEESPEKLNGDSMNDSSDDGLVGEDWWSGSLEPMEISNPETSKNGFFESVWKPLAFTSVFLLVAGVGRLIFVNSNFEFQSTVTSNFNKVVKDVKVNYKKSVYLIYFRDIWI